MATNDGGPAFPVALGCTASKTARQQALLSPA